jgi:hypothetical protein
MEVRTMSTVRHRAGHGSRVFLSPESTLSTEWRFGAASVALRPNGPTYVYFRQQGQQF